MVLEQWDPGHTLTPGSPVTTTQDSPSLTMGEGLLVLVLRDHWGDTP